MSLLEGKFKKAYFEITNVCNASCSFCPKNCRPPHFVTDEEFDTVLDKLSGRVEYLYFHLMGEPLLHPSIIDFSNKAHERGFKVVITSNGILSKKVGIPLVESGSVHKISLSLHSFESNSYSLSLDEYISDCISLAVASSRHGTYCALRLWNQGSDQVMNDRIINILENKFGKDWFAVRTGYRLSERIFLEYGDRFKWPDEDASDEGVVFCHALRDQIGILCDGTVVPCCLDAEGKIPLGNIYKDTLDDICLNSKAKAIFDGFSSHTVNEDLCRGCGYAKRFKK